MTDNNGKLRAVFLAALMVLWVFAGTMAFAGSAAAADGNLAVEVSDVSPNTPRDDATYTINHTLSVGDETAHSSINRFAVDFSGAGDADVSNVNQDDVDIVVNGQMNPGNSWTIENVDNSGQQLNVYVDDPDYTSNLDNAEVDLIIGNVRNPSAGNTYTVTTTAQDTNGNSDIASGTSQQFTIEGVSTSADESWESQSTRFQGQQLYFEYTGQNVDDESGNNEGQLSNFELRAFDSTATGYSNQVGSLETQFEMNDDGYYVVDTSELEGDYVITAAVENSNNRHVVVTGQSGQVDYVTRATPGDGAVEIALQDLSASFADESVGLGDSENPSETTLEIDSNRNDYEVVITEDSLTQEQLQNIFPGATASGEDAVSATVSADGELTATFNEENEISTGDNFTFDVEAADTTASDTANISIQEALEGDVNFEQAQITEQRGDIVTVNASSEQLDAFNITVGGDDVNYQANFTVKPNDDGNVSLEINTYYLARTGTNGGASGASADTVYNAVEGDVTAFEESNDGNRNRVLEAALYDVIAVQHSDNASQPQEFDVAVVNLEERGDTEMTVHTAPNGNFNDLTEVEDVEEAIDDGSITESDTIAIADSERDVSRNGDLIVHRVDASGIEGYVAENGLDTGTTDPDQLNVTLQQLTTEVNEDPFTVALYELDSANYRLVNDLENDALYVIVQSNALADAGAEVDDEFEAQINVTADYQTNFVSSSDAEDELANDTFTLVDREATFDTQNGEVRVSPTEDAEISGTTTVAPGTELTVRARATGESPFLRTSPATVDANGSFAAAFDFSDISEGQNFTASIRRQSFEDDAATSGVVGELETAGVSISDQEYTGQADEIVVDSAFLPEGGFVTIHDGSLLDGATFDSVRGTSDYLSEGENTDVTVTLDTPYTEDGTAIAMPHQDTNDNQEYDFVSSEGAEDSPYADANGSAITASASVTISEETATATEAPETETEAPETDTEAPETDTETPAEEQPGFGAVIALIALLGAALLAARRNAF